MLVPCTPVVAYTKLPNNKLPTGTVELGSGPDHAPGKPCAIYAMPKINPSKKPNDGDAFIVPFWFVKSTVELPIINMQLQAVSHEYDGETFTVPCFVNTKALKIGDELRAYSKSPSEKYTPFSNLKAHR